MSLVSDITSQILAAGQARAQGQRQSGAIWGNTLANIGQTIGQLPAQIQQSKIAEQDQQIKAQEMSIRKSQADALQRAQKISEQADGIVSNLMTQQPDGSFTPDRAKLTAAFTESKIPIEQQAKWFTHFDAIDASNAKFASERSESIAATANSALKSIKDGADPDSALAFAIAITKANHPNIKQEQLQPIIDAIAQGGDPVKILTTARDSLSSKYKDAEKPDYTPVSATTTGILNNTTGEVTPTGLPQPAPRITNRTELLLAASDPNSPLHAVAKAALDAEPASATKSLALQANDAHKAGDMTEYNRLLKVIKETGQADDRPPVNVSVNGGTTQGDFNKEGKEFLASIPIQWRKTVEKIANYDEDPTKAVGMRGGSRERIMQWVNQVNPQYDASQFALRNPTRKAFTIGTQGQQINAINTAMGHIDQLTGVAEQLQNGGFVPGNEAWNKLRTMFGSDKVTNFDTLKDALSGEVASVLSKSGATVSGIADAKDKIKASNSPKQLAGYVKTLLPIMGSKLEALDYQYHQAMGDDAFSALSPESKAILAKHGIQTHTGASTPPSGQPRMIYDRVKKDFVPNPNYKP